jgi:hypothetical protein
MKLVNVATLPLKESRLPWAAQETEEEFETFLTPYYSKYWKYCQFDRGISFVRPIDIPVLLRLNPFFIALLINTLI